MTAASRCAPTSQNDVAERTGPQPVGVIVRGVDLRGDPHHVRRQIGGAGDEADLGGERALRLAHGEADRHPGLEARRLRGLDLEAQEHGIVLEERRHHVAGLYVLARLDGARLDGAGDGGAHRGVTQVEGGDLDRLVGDRGVGLRGEDLRAVGLELLAGDEAGVRLARAFATRHLGFHPLLRRLRLHELRVGAVHGEPKALAVDGDEDVSGLHLLAFTERHLVDGAGDAGGDLHVLEGLDGAGRGHEVIELPPLDGQEIDGEREAALAAVHLERARQALAVEDLLLLDELLRGGDGLAGDAICVARRAQRDDRELHVGGDRAPELLLVELLRLGLREACAAVGIARALCQTNRAPAGNDQSRRFSSARSSRIDENRRAGLFSIARRITASRAAGNPATISLGRRGISVACLASVAAGESPTNGGRPVSIS